MLFYIEFWLFEWSFNYEMNPVKREIYEQKSLVH